MASGQLTSREIARLAYAISPSDMENIALGYLGLEFETIKNLKVESRGSSQQFNQEIIRRWAYQNVRNNKEVSTNL